MGRDLFHREGLIVRDVAGPRGSAQLEVTAYSSTGQARLTREAGLELAAVLDAWRSALPPPPPVNGEPGPDVPF